MSPIDPDLALADQLLGDTLHRPVPRARRIAGLYAALYLEEPLLHQWAGLAAFVARHIHLAMDSAEGLFEGFMARGNIDIYQATMPAFLRLRQGRPPPVGPFAPAMHLLARADSRALDDPASAEALAAQALEQLSVVEQRDIVAPAYRELGPIAAHLLAPLMRVRLGWDTAGPVYDFDGTDARDPAQRLQWARSEILPAWQRLRSHQGELLRSDLDRLRRWAGVRLEELPGRGGI